MSKTKADFFVPENERLDNQKEILSPSGKYKLNLSWFKTGEKTWSYSQGKVSLVGSEEPIGVVQRNYSSFPHLFIENHPSGEDFLICGEDYQGQTVINLSTGQRVDFLPEDAKQGHGFCAAAFFFDPKTQVLVIDGCIWACPYEYRLFDFSNPMQGWPELQLKDGYFDSDPRDPTFNEDGTITLYESEYPTEEQEEAAGEEDVDRKTLPIAASKTVRKEGDHLVLVSAYVSEEEAARRVRRAEAERKYKEELDKFRSEDPLYLKYSTLGSEAPWLEKTHDWVGVTHSSWCPDFKTQERRIGRDIYSKDGLRVCLEWGTVTGPIKVEISGSKAETRFFPHSVEGMVAAFEFAKSALP